MTLSLLNDVLVDGSFHHATYRCIGTLWEGLWVYRKSTTGFRGFEVAGCFPRGSVDIDAAHTLVAGTGTSLGSFGNG